MELSARKRAVLSAIIRTYIETGEPVGSKILTELLENAPCSATLRNEMSELSSLGFLAQPHTSAGRVPTSSAIRLYVTSLMNPVALDIPTKEYINSKLPSEKDIEKFPSLAAKALSELTGLPAVSYYLVDDDITVKQAQIIPMNMHSALLFLITSDGRAKSRICRISGDFNQMKERFEKIINEQVLRQPLKQLNKATLQNVIASAGLDSLELMPLMTAVFDLAADAATCPVTIENATGLYRICGEENALKIISLATNGEELVNVLNAANITSDIVFGSETAVKELEGTTIALSDYSINGTPRGKIGIIGPARMSYEQIIPSIKYTAERLSEMMSRAVNTED